MRLSELQQPDFCCLFTMLLRDGCCAMPLMRSARCRLFDAPPPLRFDADFIYVCLSFD